MTENNDDEDFISFMRPDRAPKDPKVRRRFDRHREALARAVVARIMGDVLINMDSRRAKGFLHMRCITDPSIIAKVREQHYKEVGSWCKCGDLGCLLEADLSESDIKDRLRLMLVGATHTRPASIVHSDEQIAFENTFSPIAGERTKAAMEKFLASIEPERRDEAVPATCSATSFMLPGPSVPKDMIEARFGPLAARLPKIKFPHTSPDIAEIDVEDRDKPENMVDCVWPDGRTTREPIISTVYDAALGLSDPGETMLREIGGSLAASRLDSRYECEFTERSDPFYIPGLPFLWRLHFDADGKQKGLPINLVNGLFMAACPTLDIQFPAYESNPRGNVLWVPCGREDYRSRLGAHLRRTWAAMEAGRNSALAKIVKEDLFAAHAAISNVVAMRRKQAEIEYERDLQAVREDFGG